MGLPFGDGREDQRGPANAGGSSSETGTRTARTLTSNAGIFRGGAQVAWIGGHWRSDEGLGESRTYVQGNGEEAGGYGDVVEGYRGTAGWVSWSSGGIRPVGILTPLLPCCL